MNYETLKTAITGNQAFAEALRVGNDAAIADELAKPGGTVALDTLPKSTLAAALTAGVLALPKGDAGRWPLVLQLLASLEPTLRVADSAVQGILAAAVDDALLTQEQVTAITTREGTKAEFLFGPGARVTHDDVAKALNPIRATLLDEAITKVTVKPVEVQEEQVDAVK